MKALIFDSKVVQIEAAQFPVAPALIWVDISAVLPVPEVGWSYDDVTDAFTTPPPPPPLPPKSAAPITAEELATQMITDGTMTKAKVNAIKNSR